MLTFLLQCLHSYDSLNGWKLSTCLWHETLLKSFSEIIVMSRRCQYFLNETNPKLICYLQSKCNGLMDHKSSAGKYASILYQSINKSVIHTFPHRL